MKHLYCVLLKVCHGAMTWNVEVPQFVNFDLLNIVLNLHRYFFPMPCLFCDSYYGFLVHYMDMWHPKCGFNFSSVEISSSVDCDQGKEQPTNKRFVSLFFVLLISGVHFYCVPFITECLIFQS